MFNINWGRFIVGGIIASIIAFFSDGLLHEAIVGADWKAVYDNLGASDPEHNSTNIVYFAVFDLGRGFISMFLYVLMRAHCKPGPKTAALAGIVAWIAFSLTGPAQFIPLGFYSNALWIKVTAFQLVTSIVGGIAGAALLQRGRQACRRGRRITTQELLRLLRTTLTNTAQSSTLTALACRLRRS